MNKDQKRTLPGGVEIPFRVVGPEDAPALQRLHARCSERTIYLRFFGPMRKLSDEQARYFASTDGVDHLGLVALDPQDPEEIIAVNESGWKMGRRWWRLGYPSKKVDARGKTFHALR